MVAPSGGELPNELERPAISSAAMYPEFVRELEDEAAAKPHEPHQPTIDLRSQGTILIGNERVEGGGILGPEQIAELEPHLALSTASAKFIQENSVDSRGLMSPLLRSLNHRGIDPA